MNIPEKLFREPIENKFKNIYIPKSLKQIARGNIKIDGKQLNKELAKKIINPYYFTDRNTKIGFEIDLDSHHINHANSKLTVTPNFAEFGIEFRFINKNIKELSVIYGKLINQYIFKHQAFFSTRFDKQDEDNQLLDKTELFINFKINNTLTETDIDNIDVKSPLEHHIQLQGLKDSGWRFDRINLMTTYFFTKLVN